MGVKKVFNKLVNKVVAAFAGETASQKSNKALKALGLNVFSNLIICGELPPIPKNSTYILSMSEMTRLTEIFSMYNENAAKVEDAVLKPVISRQIKSNGTIIEFFDSIKNSIKNIPSKKSDDVEGTYKKCLDSVNETIKLMYGLKSKLASKMERNFIKSYVDTYLEGVLRAKPDGGVYWEEFLVWLTKIIDQNVVHLGDLKTKLLNAKPPKNYGKDLKEDDEKNKKSSKKKTPAEVIEEIRAQLVEEYKNEEENVESGGIGQFFANILSGKAKEQAVNRVNNFLVGEASKALNRKTILPEIKILSKINSKKFKFMGFKSASMIKDQLDAYKSAPTRTDSIVIYKTQNEIIEKILKVLETYIDLKNQKIKTDFINATDYNKAVDSLTEVKDAMNKCFSDIQGLLANYKSKISGKNVQHLYLQSAVSNDPEALKRFFKVTRDKKVMFFEEYAHELYEICGNSIKNLDQIINPKDLYIDVDTLQIDRAKFSIKDKDWKTFNPKVVSQNIDNKFKANLDKIKKDLDGISKSVDDWEKYCDESERNWNKIREDLESFYEEYEDVEKVKKQKTNITSLAQEIDKLSTDMQNNLSKYEIKKSEILQSINGFIPDQKDSVKDLSRDLVDLRSTKANIENTKSKLIKKIENYNKIDENIRKLVDKEKIESQKRIDNFEGDFNKILTSLNDKLNSIQSEYEKVKKEKIDIKPIKDNLIEKYEKDKDKTKKIEDVYKNICDTEKALISDIDNKIEHLQYWTEEIVSTEIVKFRKDLDGLKKEEIFVRAKLYNDFLEKMKKVQKDYNLSVASAEDKIKDLKKHYSDSEKMMRDSEKQTWGEWFGSFFG